ncbi:hypothetical protein VDG05_17450 [Xanthomonas campestris pv. raphani]|uniref:hypothetical protein n=1 Tax=Xanthomonas TaxID=338 RepID=UPI000CEEF922|nr:MULTISPECIES: hypothetical protein [Xanthomonas]MEA9886094.1 hypothetical protein [Xanthomonas campestris pv. raphani]PPT80698.1 hypothetical protein XarbCFBP8152_05515 [Xanthomonas arboricola]
MTTRNRFLWWFVVRLLLSRRASRKAARLYPAEARVAQARDKGFAWWQWWAMTVLGALGAFAVLSGPPMFLFVVYAQLTQIGA